MSNKSSKGTTTITTHYDGGGGNKVTSSVSEGQNTRTVTGSDGTTHTEAEVITSYDGGGKNTSWVRVDPALPEKQVQT